MTASTSVAGRTVLVADDTAFVRDRFKAAIEAAGHSAVTAQSGQELLAIKEGIRQPCGGTRFRRPL